MAWRIQIEEVILKREFKTTKSLARAFVFFIRIKAG